MRRYMAAVVVLVMVLAACGGTEDGTTTEAAQTTAGTDTTAAGAETTSAGEEPATTASETGEPSGDPIRIGGSLGLTGAFAGPSEHYRILYEAAVEEINSQGGLLGRPVELILYDDESTPETAQALYQRLINEDQVDVLLAPYTTFIGGAVLPVVRPSEKVFMNAGFVGTELARQYDRIFMTWTFQEPDWTRPFFEMLDGFPEGEQPETMAVLTAQNPFTVMERDGFEGEAGVLNYAEERGIEVVVNEEYATDATDLSGLVRRAADAEADALVVLALPNDGALIARTVAEVGYNPDFYCSCGSSVTTFPAWADLTPEASNHVYSVVTSWQTDDPAQFPGLDRVVEIFEEQGFAEMPAYAPVAYAAIQIISQAVEETGGTDSAALTEFLQEGEFQTAAGTIDFGEFGLTEFSGGLVQYVDGTNELVWPSERATSEPVIP